MSLGLKRVARSHVDARIVAYLASAHYSEHLLFCRIEQDLAPQERP